MIDLLLQIIRQVVSFTMQAYNNSFRIAEEVKQIQVGQGNNRLVIYDNYQKGKKGKQIDGIITNSIRLTKNYLTFFTNKQVFNTYLINKNQCIKTQIVNKSDWINSIYSLYYFNRNSEVCLIQKNQSLQKTRISYFNFIISQDDDINFIQIGSKQLEEGIHKEGKEIFAINNEGKIGCYQFISGKMNILLYNREDGVKKYTLELHELHSIFTQTQFKVLDMWLNDNLLFLIVNPAQNISSFSSESRFSPILIANIEKEGQCPVSFSFSFYKMNETYNFSIDRCINLQDYCVLLIKDKNSSALPYYVYNKELQAIVLQGSYNPSHSVDKVYKHNTIVFYQQNQNTVKCYQKQFYYRNSLSFKKTLQLLQNAQSLKQKLKKAVIIFGCDKTGKSTFRHFLSGGKMIFNNDQERGFSEVVAQDDEMKDLEHDEQREKISWMNTTEEAAIIDVPDWNFRDPSFKVELSVLLSRLFRIFNEFHFIITIPFEYIQDSLKNQQFFRNLLELVSNQEGIEQYITIFLTKVDSGEESLQAFNERIEEITQINQQSGSLIRKISEYNQILPFQNREFNQNQGKQMLSSILSFKFLSFMDRDILPVQSLIQQPSEQINHILTESQHYIRILNTYLLSISYSINFNSFAYVQNILQSHFIHHYNTPLQFNDITHKENVALAFIVVLARLKSVLGQEKYDENAISKLKDVLMQLDAILQGGDFHFKQTILCFICVMRNAFTLPLRNTIGNKIHPLADFKKILINESDAVLGKNIKYILNYLQEFESVRSSEEIKEFSSLISKSKPKIKKIIKIEMSYDQQKRQFLQKKGEILQKICSLPANALKLDLILQQIYYYSLKASLQDKDYKVINFYLREASRICQYHHLYFEAILLLAVIPDFYGLELLIDDFVQFLKKNNSYQNKKLLNIIQYQLVDKLLTLCRECVRDNLVKKLINLKSLSAQLFSKPASLRKSQLQNLKDYLSNSESIKRYKQRLQNKDINFFYNIKDSDFQKMLQEKDQIIKKCQQFETQQVTRKRFQDKQALRYVLDVIPLPSHD